MGKFYIWFAGTVLLGVFLITACRDKSNEPDSCDRLNMLRHYAEKMIIPAFEKAHQEVVNLKTGWSAFAAQPTIDQITGLQARWTDAYSAWQFANAWNFGPAGEAGLKLSLVMEIGVFPINPAVIESKITAANFSTSDAQRDSRGYLALEYLLFKDSALLVNDTNRRAYFEAVIVHLEQELYRVKQAWQSWQSEFINDPGTAAGSPTSVLYNEFLRSFEDLKNLKMAKPMGLTNFFMLPVPDAAEAYYSGQSLLFLKLHLAALEDIYAGRTQDGADGIGLKDHLECLTGGPALNTTIEKSLHDIHTALAAIPTDKPLSELMAENHLSLQVFYNAIKNHVRYFGSDMSSILVIAITFDSGDGD